jgi:hypothetical protein
MIVFLDFEASSLGKGGFPIEIGWIAEDGAEESHLIRPAPGWEEWNADAERIDRIPLQRLLDEGTPHDTVAHRMTERLTGHHLFASAPSWDGQWLSKLLRAAGLPRHALRLRDTEEAHRLAAMSALKSAGVPEGLRPDLVDRILGEAWRSAEEEAPAHRSLDDAPRELRVWRDVGRRATEAATQRAVMALGRTVE